MKRLGLLFLCMVAAVAAHAATGGTVPNVVERGGIYVNPSTDQRVGEANEQYVRDIGRFPGEMVTIADAAYQGCIGGSHGSTGGTDSSQASTDVRGFTNLFVRAKINPLYTAAALNAGTGIDSVAWVAFAVSVRGANSASSDTAATAWTAKWSMAPTGVVGVGAAGAITSTRPDTVGSYWLPAYSADAPTTFRADEFIMIVPCNASGSLGTTYRSSPQMYFPLDRPGTQAFKAPYIHFLVRPIAWGLDDGTVNDLSAADGGGAGKAMRAFCLTLDLFGVRD